MTAKILKLKMFLAIFVACIFSASFVSSADIFYNPAGGGEPNSCGEVSNEIPTTSSSGGFNNNASRLRCITDIDGLKLTLHKAGLCTSAPDTSDPSTDWSSKCVFIINDATGIEVSVTKTSQSSIPENKIDLSGLVEATYTHAVLMVGNSLQTKMNAKFEEDFRGSNGEGPFCYSINASDPGNNPAAYADLAVKCVADEAAMTLQGDHDFSSKQFTSFRSGNSYSNAKTAANGDEVYVFSDMDTIATVANDGSSDATKVVGVLEMATPAVVSPSSTNFDAGFQLTEQGQIRFSGAGVCASASLAGATACITSMRNYGVGFKVTVK